MAAIAAAGHLLGGASHRVRAPLHPSQAAKMGRVPRLVGLALLTLTAYGAWRWKGVPFERIDDENVHRMLHYLTAAGGKLVRGDRVWFGRAVRLPSRLLACTKHEGPSVSDDEWGARIAASRTPRRRRCSHRRFRGAQATCTPPLDPQGGATVGRACPTCPRGLIATRPLWEGEGVLQVPVELALPIT